MKLLNALIDPHIKKIKKEQANMLKMMRLVNVVNTWKDRINQLSLINPWYLFAGFVIILPIPFIPNIPLYMMFINKTIPKWVKWTCSIISLLVMAFYNVAVVYLLFK